MLYVWSRREFSSAIGRLSDGGTQRSPAPSPFDALDGGGGAQREPEPAVAGEALLGREVVDVELGRLDREATGARRRVDQHEAVVARPVHVGHHAGRRLVVRVGVRVDGRVGDQLGVRARFRSQHDRVVEERRGGGHGRELGGELAEHEVLGPPVDEAERGGVPERGASAVAEQHLVAVGQREQVGQAGPDAADDRPHPAPAVAGPEVRAAHVGERTHRFGPHLRRSGAEAPVAGDQLGGQGDGGGIDGHRGEVTGGSYGVSPRVRRAAAPR